MTFGDINLKVIVERVFWISQMIDSLRDLCIEDKSTFLADRHKIAAAESYLRRALEALFDIGRHILAKGFASPTTEYKEIAKGLQGKKVFGEDDAEMMRKMADYRNRMVHFYHEIAPEELHEICLNHLDEIKLLAEKMVRWAKDRLIHE